MLTHQNDCNLKFVTVDQVHDIVKRIRSNSNESPIHYFLCCFTKVIWIYFLAIVIWSSFEPTILEDKLSFVWLVLTNVRRKNNFSSFTIIFSN